MTVFTSVPTSGDKADEKAKEAAGVHVPPTVGVDGDANHRPSLAWSDDTGVTSTTGVAAWFERSAYRQRAFRFMFIFTVIMLTVFLAAVTAMVAMRHMHHRRYRGVCGTRYRDGASRHEAARLFERIDVDADNGWEMVEVPTHGRLPPSVFVHDFTNGMTAVVDNVRGRCFVKELDRVRVSSPEVAVDALKDKHSGFYEGESRVVRETYRVRQTESLSDIASPQIREFCRGHHTFLITKVDAEEFPLEAMAGGKAPSLPVADGPKRARELDDADDSSEETKSRLRAHVSRLERTRAAQFMRNGNGAGLLERRKRAVAHEDDEKEHCYTGQFTAGEVLQMCVRQ